MQAPEFWRDPTSRRARLLSPFGALYGLAGRARFALVRPWRAPVPVLCVGNLTAGGTGKTPIAMALGEMLTEQGVAAHFLTRGYGGAERGPHRVDAVADSARRVGDEALLLAMRGPTWVAADRVAGAKAAVEAGAEALLLDDGFQNPSLAKDLSLVVVDAETGFGNGRLIPAGPLRESASRGLARAQAMVVMGKGPFEPPADFAGPVLRARLRPVFAGMSLTAARVAAFAGIGRPEKFFAMLKSMGAQVVIAEPFPDHCRYDQRILDRLAARAMLENAMLVTTEKDAVRLPARFRRRVTTVMAKARFDDPEAAAALLKDFIAFKRPR